MKHRMKFYLLGLMIIIIVGAVFIYSPGHDIKAENEARGRIAFVDVWAVFNVHPRKQAAEEQLNQLAQSMQAELEEKARDLPKDEQEQMLEDYQSRLSQKEQDLIQDIIDTIRGVIKTVAEEKEVRLVLDKKDVIYGGYDMTQDVIDYINQQNGGSSSQSGSTDNNSGSTGGPARSPETGSNKQLQGADLMENLGK